MPLISVIVPVYNVEKYLSRCIDSILVQTLSDFELLLIDDGSTDNSPSICDEWAEKDQRIFVVHKENEGVSAARNTGLKIFQGEWIAFVDSDDYIHPKYLSKLYNACMDFNTKISVCGYVRTEFEVLEDTVVENDTYPSVVYQTEDFWCDVGINAIAPWGRLIHKSLCANVLFPTGKIHEDAFTMHEFMFKTDRIVYISAELYHYRLNPKSIIGRGWYKERMDVVEAFRCQTEFFRTNGFYRAEKVSAKKYCDIAIGHYERLKADKQYVKEKKQLKKEIRSLLIRYEDLLIGYGDGYYYYQFFPLEMRVKDYWRAFKRKIEEFT